MVTMDSVESDKAPANDEVTGDTVGDGKKRPRRTFEQRLADLELDRKRLIAEKKAAESLKRRAGRKTARKIRDHRLIEVGLVAERYLELEGPEAVDKVLALLLSQSSATGPLLAWAKSEAGVRSPVGQS